MDMARQSCSRTLAMFTDLRAPPFFGANPAGSTNVSKGRPRPVLGLMRCRVGGLTAAYDCIRQFSEGATSTGDLRKIDVAGPLVLHGWDEDKDRPIRCLGPGWTRADR